MPGTDRTGLEGYEALVSELRATAPSAPERLRDRVLELAPEARTRMSGRRRLVFVVAPTAAVLAVGAALVHGFVSSGSRAPLAGAPTLGVSLGPPAVISHTARTNAEKAVQGKQALRNTPTYGASSNHKLTAGAGYYALGANPTPKALAGLSTDSLARTLFIPKNRLVHADASLEVRVPNHARLTRATNNATQIVSKLGGYAQNVQYQASRSGYGTAFLALRVPVGNAEKAIGRLANLGTLVSQQVATQDLQQQLNHENNGIGSLKRAIAIYQQALQNGSLSASERVDIQIKLANAEHAITQLRKNRGATLESGATADISLTLTTHKGAIGGGHHKQGRFGRLLGSARNFLALEGIIVLYALIVVAPLLVLGGLGWWLARERRRREERLLASA